jgi:hypothetical protein
VGSLVVGNDAVEIEKDGANHSRPTLPELVVERQAGGPCPIGRAGVFSRRRDYVLRSSGWR